MLLQIIRVLLLSLLLNSGLVWSMSIEEAMQSPNRQAANVARDRYRHPLEALTFFDVKPGMNIVEVWPATGWWTEILGPYTKYEGIYYAAGFSMTARRTPDWRKEMQVDFTNMLADGPDYYSHIVSTELSIPERTTMAPPGTVDRVLTFRNVHNWMKGDYAEGMFKAMHRALKSGGVLGVVEHRAKPGTSLKAMIESGYVTEKYMIQLAKRVGFILDARSELNANAADVADHPAGVWTLPPSLRYCKKLGEAKQPDCFKKYRLIGESDRMTLRFIKP